MEVHKKLKIARQHKGWTQEKLAEELGWAINNYAKIERGEVNITVEKLKQVAEALGIEMQELIKENPVFNFAENCTHGFHSFCAHSNLAHTTFLTEAQCVHEIEKSRLIIEQRDKEIGWLREENARLKEIIGLLKQSGKTAGAAE